jgi:hypothetical protein
MALAEIVWLFTHATSTYYDTIYFKWIIADVLINLLAGWAYLSKLQRIQFE